MGCVEGGDITEEEIKAAQQDHERAQKIKAKQKSKKGKRKEVETSSHFSKTGKSFNITATPSGFHDEKDIIPDQKPIYGTTLSVENANKTNYKKKRCTACTQTLLDRGRVGKKTKQKCICLWFACSQCAENTVTTNLSVLCVIYSFDKVFPIANFDPVLDVTDMTSNEALRYFGGERRTQRLTEHLKLLTSEMQYEVNTQTTVRSKEIFVVSDTLKTVQMCTLLEKVGLLDKFTKFDDLQNSGIANHVIGVDHKYMSEGASKNMAVFKIMQSKKYAHDQILYVDNIKSVVEYFNSIALCRTVFVEDEYGIGNETCQRIEQMFEKEAINAKITL
ncbi:hypothetical protein RFI_10666 [Reticulomyxa filosa]|uniref:Uncharacterized protein n=1 Tax=Reticulomyxa filosa TaxID=46433 RepID=X6NJI7_RETFI|nr:hypothetical protein RFI_10666 [Reticulomyxa filosa]|eukprot:ETO26465.1 hypothetical protein RFI_10666 [Reticulomyxa filosa]